MAVGKTARMVVLGVLGFGLASAWIASAQAQDEEAGDQAATVGVDNVIREHARQNVPVVGRLVARRSGVVSVLSQGVVADMRVRVGDRVQAGDMMAKLSTNRLGWARELRAAELETAKAELSLRERELQRLANLKQSAAFSAARYEDAVQELAKAESDAARASANLNLSEIDLANAEIIAPYPGVVAEVHTEIGTYLNTGQPVVTLVDDSQMEIEAEVPANHTQGLAPGTAVTFTIRDGGTRTAQVRAVVPSENPLTRTRKVRFTPKNGAALTNAAANQSVTLSIPAGPARDVVTVHKDAVLNKSGQRMVFVVEDGKADMRTVDLGEAVGTRFVVMSGLSIGDTVVVRGNERLIPGQTVETKPNGQY